MSELQHSENGDDRVFRWFEALNGRFLVGGRLKDAVLPAEMMEMYHGILGGSEVLTFDGLDMVGTAYLRALSAVSHPISNVVKTPSDAIVVAFYQYCAKRAKDASDPKDQDFWANYFKNLE